MKIKKNKIIKFKLNTEGEEIVYRGFYDKGYGKFVVTWINKKGEIKCTHYPRSVVIEYFLGRFWIKI